MRKFPVLVYLDDGGGIASPSGFHYMPNGSYQLTGTPSNSPAMRIADLKRNGVPVFSRQAFIKIINPQTQNKVMNYKGVQANSSQTIKGAETAHGQYQKVRAEVPSLVGDILTWNLILDNTLGAADVEGVIGDGWDLIALKRAFPAFPATFVIGGVFGAATLAQINKIVGHTPVRVHYFQGEASDSAFWSSVPFKTATTDLQGSLTERIMDFNLSQDGTQFNTEFRLIKDFRYIFSRNNGLTFKIPAGKQVALTFKVQSYAAAALMEKIN